MGKHIKYTNETRIKAVEMYLDGISKQEIIEKLNIKDQRRVTVWVNRYLEGDTAFIDKRGKNSKVVSTNFKDKSKMTKDEYIAFLEMENDILKFMAEMKTK